MHTLLFQRSRDLEKCAISIELLKSFQGTSIVVAPWAGILKAEIEKQNVDDPSALPCTVVLGGNSQSSFDPFDWINPKSIDADFEFILEAFAPTDPSSIAFTPSGLVGEPSWNRFAFQLLKTLIRAQFAAAQRRKEPCPNIYSLCNLLVGDDVIYRLAELLKSRGFTHDENEDARQPHSGVYFPHDFLPFDIRFLESFLALHDDIRSRVVAIAQAKCISMYDPEQVRFFFETSADMQGCFEKESIVAIETSPFPKRNELVAVELWMRTLVLHYLRRGTKLNLIIDSPCFWTLFSCCLKSLQVERELLSSHSFWNSWSAFQQASQSNDLPMLAEFEQAYLIPPLAEVNWADLTSKFIVEPAEDCFPDLQVAIGRKAMRLKWVNNGLGQQTVAEIVNLQDGNQVTSSSAQRSESIVKDIHSLLISPDAQRREAMVVEFLKDRKPLSVVYDPTGVFYKACMESRAIDSARLLRLDPFGVFHKESDSFNPFDVIASTDIDPALTIYDMVDILLDCLPEPFDRFWDMATEGLIRAVAQYLQGVPERGLSLRSIWEVIHSDDTVYNLAVVLDTIGKRLPKDCYHTIAIFLQHSDALRSRILTEISNRIIAFGNASISKVTDKTSDRFSTKVHEPGSIVFVAIPPYLQKNFHSLALFWLSNLLEINQRNIQNRGPTQFVLDSSDSTVTHFMLSQISKRHQHKVGLNCVVESADNFMNRFSDVGRAFLENCAGLKNFGVLNHPPQIDHKQLTKRDVHRLTRSPLFAQGVQPKHRITLTTGTWVPSHKNKGRRERGEENLILIGSATDQYLSDHLPKDEHFFTISADRAKTNSRIFNPFQLLHAAGDKLSEESLAFSDFLLPKPAIGSIDPYWAREGQALLFGLLQYLGSEGESQCNFNSLMELLYKDDISYQIALVLDRQPRTIPNDCFQILKSFLQKSDAERSGFISEVLDRLRLTHSSPLLASDSKLPQITRADLQKEPWTIALEADQLYPQSSTAAARTILYSLVRLIHLDRLRPIRIVADHFASRSILGHDLEAFYSPFVEINTHWESLIHMRLVFGDRLEEQLISARSLEIQGPLHPMAIAGVAQKFRLDCEHLRNLSCDESMTVFEN